MSQEGDEHFKNTVINSVFKGIKNGRIINKGPSGKVIGAERFNDDIKFLLEECLVEDRIPEGFSVKDFIGDGISVRRATHQVDAPNFVFEVETKGYGTSSILVPVMLPEGEDTSEPVVLFGIAAKPSHIKIINKRLGTLSLELYQDAVDEDFVLELDAGSFYMNSDELAVDHPFVSSEITQKIASLFDDPLSIMELHLATGSVNLALEMLASGEPGRDEASDALITRVVEGILQDNKEFMVLAADFLPGGESDLSAAGYTGLLNYIDEESIYRGALSIANSRYGVLSEGLLAVSMLLCHGAERAKIQVFQDALELAYGGSELTNDTGLTDNLRAFFNKAAIEDEDSVEPARKPKMKL